MAKVKRGRSRRLVLDIGSHTIRLCELTPTKTGYQLTKYIQREVLKDPALDEEQRRAQRVHALKSILAEAKVRSRRVVFGVPGRSVFTRTRALPPVPEHKVTQIVRYEIQQQIPFSLDQIALDYQVVDRTETGGYEVLMLAIKVDVVEKELEILRDVKRSVHVVDVCPLAAYNWMKHAGWGGESDDCVALLDMGAATTDIIIEREGLFRFTRPLNLGGNDITAAISKEFGLNFLDSEKLKRQRGFAPTGDPKRDGKGGEVIGRVLSRLVSEINRSFAYFRSQPGGGMVSRVVITGGAACLRNMVPYLQRELGLPVSVAQPLAGLEIGPGAQAARQFPHQTCVALGLALRCCQTVPIEINLIPPRVIEIARRKEQAFYWGLVLATLALIMASIIPVRANENKNVRQVIRALEQQVQLYDPELVPNPTGKSRFEGDLEAAKANVERRKNQVSLLDTAITSRRFWLDQFTKINDGRPPGNKIWFSAVESTTIDRSARGSAGMGRGVMRRSGGSRSDARRAARQGGSTSALGTPRGQGGPGYASSGFCGLEPRIAGSDQTGPRRGGRPGRSNDGFGSGGIMAAGMSAGFSGFMLLDRQARSAPPPAANGLRIFGYARDKDALIEFIANLKAENAFTPEGVLYDEAWFQMVSVFEMDDARVAESAAMATSGGAFGLGEEERGGRLSGFGRGGGTGMYGGAGRATASTYPVYGETVISFVLDVQFPETIKKPGPEPAPGEKGPEVTNPLLRFGQEAGEEGGGGGARESRRDRRERRRQQRQP